MVTPPNEKIWESFLLVKIEEMERRFGIGIPWKRELRSRQNRELATRYMLPAIARGNGTVKKIATALNLSERIVCHHISELERDGLIQVERGSKPHRINIRSEQDSGTCLFQFPSQCCAHAVEHVEGGVGPS
jgi:DNA-binding MarR family transcriptional regulator